MFRTNLASQFLTSFVCLIVLKFCILMINWWQCNIWWPRESDDNHGGESGPRQLWKSFPKYENEEKPIKNSNTEFAKSAKRSLTHFSSFWDGSQAIDRCGLCNVYRSTTHSSQSMESYTLKSANTGNHDVEKIRQILHFNENTQNLPRDNPEHDRIYRKRPVAYEWGRVAMGEWMGKCVSLKNGIHGRDTTPTNYTNWVSKTPYWVALLALCIKEKLKLTRRIPPQK